MHLTPLVFKVVGEKMYVCLHTCKKGPNWDYFGSSCHLSTVEAGDKVAFKHRRQCMTSNKKGQANRKPVSCGEKPSFLKIFFPSFPNDFFQVTKNRAFVCGQKGQTTKEKLKKNITHVRTRQKRKMFVLSAQGPENKPPLTACGEKCGCSPACTL